LNQAEPQLHQT